MSKDKNKKKKQSSNILPFPQINDIKFDGEMRSKVAHMMRTRNLSVSEVDAVDDLEYDIDLQIQKRQLQKWWGTRYHELLEETKKFTDTLPSEVRNKPLTDTAQGIKFILRHKQLLDHLNPTRKLH